MTKLPNFFIFLLLTYNCDATKNVSIVIVGAGAAGIAAATRLLENSFTNITVLEAQNRIGGRIYTTHFENNVIDLGAQYCHGENGNIVHELVENLDLLEPSNITELKLTKIYISNGEVVPSGLALDLQNFLFFYSNKINQNSDSKLGDEVLRVYNETLIKKYSSDESKLKVAKDALKFIHGGIVIYEGAYSWDLLPSSSHFEECEGYPNLSWKNYGYRIILDILMKSYPDSSKKLPIDDKIFLNKKVEKIVWSGNVARVQTSDNLSLIANHVIFTPSIGVLKDQRNTLFEPELPENKQQAVEAIGFDAIMKIFLHFPHKWWNDDVSFFDLIWRKEDLLNITNEFPDGPQKDGILWVSSIVTLMKINNKQKNILLLWVSGDLIPKIEKAPEDVILKQCNYFIKMFLGKDYNVSDADKLIRTDWKTNPNIRGSYSYEKFGFYKKNTSYNAELAEPLLNSKGSPALLFAGEATNPIHYSTVHGAIETGRREADRIIKLHEN